MGTSALGALLVKEGLLTQQDRMIIGKSTGQTAWAFAKGVLASGLLDETELASLLAERTSFSIAPRNFTDTAEHDALAAVDVNLMQELEVYPLKLSGRTLTVAMCDPLDKSMWNQLVFFTGFKIKPVIAPLSDIRAGLKRLNPNFEPTPSEFEAFFHNHAPAAYRQQARHEKPAARVSHAASLLPDEPVIEKVSFPKLEDLPPIAATAPRQTAADVASDEPASTDLVLDDLPPLEGDDTADIPFADADLDAGATDDLPLEDVPIEPDGGNAPVTDEHLSLEEAEAALNANDLDFDLGEDGASLDLDLEAPQAPAPSEVVSAADDAVPVDELVAEGEDRLADVPRDADIALTDAPDLTDLGADEPLAEDPDLSALEDDLTLPADAPDLSAIETADALAEGPDLAGLEADDALTEALDVGELSEETLATEDLGIEAPEHELVADLSLGEESLLGDIPIDTTLGDDFTDQVVFHPAMSDLNQALLYLSFAGSREDAFQSAVTGWADVTPCGVIYELEGKDAQRRFAWDNGSVRTSGLEAWRTPLAAKLAEGAWQEVPSAAPFTSWAKVGKLVGCRVGEDRKIVMIAATKAQTWQIEGFQQAVLALLQGLAKKMALPSRERERKGG